MEQSFVGRQPIYREGVDVFAYELLSRNSELSQAAFTTGDKETASALLTEFINVGLESVVGPHPAFANVPRDFILSEYCSEVPKEGVVLQVGGDAHGDDAVLGALSRLASDGYSIALTDFLYHEDFRPFAELADTVKLNVRALDRDAVAKQVDALRPFNIKLLAEGVETHDDYQFCKDLGFDYFEGYFFCKPQASDRVVLLPHNRLSTLQLLSKLQNPEISLNELEQAVGQDVAMSYRILRYLNSPINALPRQVDSLRHAIVLIGTALIRQWASVIWLESIEDKPRELMIMSMVRAQMCQQLGASMGCRNLDQFFTVGLLSLLDALMDRPMESVLQELPLVPSVKDALSKQSGTLGAALSCVRAYEQCDWNKTSCGNLDETKIRESYLSSVAWSRAVIHELVN